MGKHGGLEEEERDGMKGDTHIQGTGREGSWSGSMIIGSICLMSINLTIIMKMMATVEDEWVYNLYT